MPEWQWEMGVANIAVQTGPLVQNSATYAKEEAPKFLPSSESLTQAPRGRNYNTFGSLTFDYSHYRLRLRLPILSYSPVFSLEK